MPLVFTTSLATPGTSSTSGVTNTEVGTVSLKTASQGRNIFLQMCSVIGRANALTSISGIAFRIITATTASTAGTGATPFHADSTANVTATAVAATGQTISATGRRNHVIFGCGAGGPGGWNAINADSLIGITPNATAPSVDVINVAAALSLTYEWSVQHQE